MEHPLLTFRSMRRSCTSFVAIVLAGLCAPSLALAQLAPMFQPFGSHGANSNLQTQPIGASECTTPIPFTFNPVMTTTSSRYIDVWYASSNMAGCQLHATRANLTTPVCTYLGSYPYTPVTMSALVSLSGMDLFGSCATNATRTFYFFDTASTHENTLDLTPFWVLTAQLSAMAPTAPVITNTALAGDAVVTINWNAASFTTLGVSGQVYIYTGPSTACGTSVVDAGGTRDAAFVDANPMDAASVDADVDTGVIDSGPTDTGTPDTGTPDTGPADAGTPGTDAGTSGSFVGGGTAPGMTLWTVASSTNPINLDTARLGWSNAHYGETVAIAIAVVDSAHNVSPLSNVVCASHIVVTGFWDAYCAAHGMSDAACTSYYRGCSVGTPSRRNDPLALGLGLVIAGLFVLRRRRR